MAAALEVPDAEALLASVRDEMGLTDFGEAGDPDFRPRLARLLENAREQDPALPAVGALLGVLHWLLGTRLQLLADHARYPIAGERVAQPLIVVGEPRAGTTLLHALLAEDRRGRAPRFWEVFYPSPPPGLADGSDGRRERADRDWRELLDQIPRWLVSHPYNDALGMGLPECERLWAIDLRSTPPSAWWRVPLLGLETGLAQDFARQYAIHRMMLQQLQYGSPPRHWVLKGTSHHVRLAALLDTYPNARLLWVHRDPVVTSASFQELIAQIYEGIVEKVDRVALAAGKLEGIRSRIRTVMEDPLTGDPRIRHVTYHEVAADPVAAVRDAYRDFGMEFSDRHRDDLRAWLERNRADRYGKFSYSLDALGCDLGALYEEFQPYFERFDVRAERRP